VKLDARTNTAKEPGGTLPNRKIKREDFIINGISGMRLTNANLVAYGAVRRAERAPQGRGYSIYAIDPEKHNTAHATVELRGL